MTPDTQAHYRNIRKVLLAVLLLNWFVAAIKIFYGLLTRCGSISADGFHSLSDGTSNIIGVIGIHLACQPKDEDHPYGHKKYETLFSLAIAALILFVSFNLLRSGIQRLRHPITPEVDAVSFIVMLFTLAVNIGVMRYEYKRGKELQSDILVSDSQHTRADIFTSLSVIVTLVLIQLGYPILDSLATIMIAIFIAWVGFSIAKESSDVLCDTAPLVDVTRISTIVLGIKGVRTCHKIRSRGRPDDIFVDLHVQVDRGMHVETAHKISFAIENEIKKNIPQITDVLVHIEPISG